MKKDINIFVLTSEYHFLLSMNIIHDRYSANEFRNILIFTGERLSGIDLQRLPDNVETAEINVRHAENLKEKLHAAILQHALKNLFVFTAYRDLETYLLTTVDHSVDRHLVQDGANFYFRINKSVTWSRIKETLKIYRNLWRKGVFLKKVVLYKKHMAQCGFIDYVWITNPEIYQKPRYSRKPVIKIDLLKSEASINACCNYFAMNERHQYSNALIYLSSRLTREIDILSEISLIKSVIAKLDKLPLLIKLHPDSSAIQVDLFRAAFNDAVVKDYVPAELHIARATNSYIIGGVTASLFYNNSSCMYFTLVKIYQRLGIFPGWIEAKLPAHVKVIENLKELSQIDTNQKS